jgi:hypothetical protein
MMPRMTTQPRRVIVPMSALAMERLARLAHAEHRSPRDQAALILERQLGIVAAASETREATRR